jgi:XRE family aerobic/anaerobic benzoate catabolism transcriptional regulator
MNEPNRHLAVKVIGSAIRDLREKRGLTLEKLATNASISYQYLSGIETGKENFSIAILEKIAKALDMPLVNLISAAYGREFKLDALTKDLTK